MAIFEKSDAKFVKQMKNRHLRGLLLDRLNRQRKISFFLVVIQSLGALGVLLGDSEENAWFLVIWMMFVMVFTLTDLKIKAMKFINAQEADRAEQHGGRISSEGTSSAPPDKSSP